MNLREGTSDRLGWAGQSELARSDYTKGDDDGLVIVQHQRRKSVPRANAIATAYSALTFDRYAEIVERGDIAPDRPAIDAEPVGDLGPGREVLRLEQLEQLEQTCGRRHCAGSQAQIAGGNRPIFELA